MLTGDRPGPGTLYGAIKRLEDCWNSHVPRCATSPTWPGPR
ncbi:hypothetical protein Dfulv_14855 [Dactylosporangium fulvum]|uniref:Transcription regulator PadR N-terminal domain-containing protein n=1 Tax=Dactylosporangium fulvum TaxID=53359 RepID=A0ABY5W8P2_9ACTN|nr:hypothetical protein Dfulv_14855 [Dactylosporangium fulvum]